MEKWSKWLETCALMGPVTAEYIDPTPGSSGIFRKSISELWRRQDLLGRVQIRCREEFSVVRNLPDKNWPEEFALWVRQNADGAPVSGQDLWIRVVDGKKQKDPSAGVGRYAVTLRAEYTILEA